VTLERLAALSLVIELCSSFLRPHSLSFYPCKRDETAGCFLDCLYELVGWLLASMANSEDDGISTTLLLLL
jgi:hypothetical protein